MALATADPNDTALAIQVGYLQTGHFRHAESRAIHSGQNRPMAKIPRHFEQRLDFVLAQDDGQLFLVTRQWNPLDLNLSIQRVAIEKSQGANSLDVRGELDPLFVEEKQLPGPHILQAQLIRRFIEM